MTDQRKTKPPRSMEPKPASERVTGHTEAWSLALTWAKPVAS